MSTANQASMDAFRAQIENPAVKVKLHADTYIKFDGSDHIVIQNAFSESAVRIKYDILLVIYELVNWKALEELLAPWPEGDQKKIIDYTKANAWYLKTKPKMKTMPLKPKFRAVINNPFMRKITW
jgi:hypothetical protein